MKKKIPSPAGSEENEDFYSEYAGITNTVRVWFVSFGIGGLYLLLTTKDLLDKLKTEGEIKTIAILFLIGIGVQLFIAILNKWINWFNYFYNGKERKGFAKFVEKLSEQFWLDILCDIITCICFGKIIWTMINIFSK